MKTLAQPSQNQLRAGEAATWGGTPKPKQPQLRVTFRVWQNDARTVLGFLKIELTSGLIIDGAKLMIGPQGRRWIAMPAIKQTDAEGRPRLVDGKQIWASVVEFRDSKTRDRFQEQVLQALCQTHPELFQGATT